MRTENTLPAQSELFNVGYVLNCDARQSRFIRSCNRAFEKTVKTFNTAPVEYVYLTGIVSNKPFQLVDFKLL